MSYFWSGVVWSGVVASWMTCILVTYNKKYIQSKNRFYFCRWTGLRDDLEFLLDEELSHIQLCSLHQEMRNTEQLLGSLGLFAYRIGTLKACNEALVMYGPENTRCYERIQVKLRTGQQTAVIKSNIHVSSMSGKWIVI